MSDYPREVTALLQALLHDPDGKPDLRRAAASRAAEAGGGTIDAEGAALPELLAPWVDAIATRAWTITDEDLAKLTSAGVDEDTVYEATVAAAVGASLARMQAGLRALDATEAPAAPAAANATAGGR
jgi:hypothetical protein